MMIHEEIAEDEEGGGESEYTSEDNIIVEEI